MADSASIGAGFSNYTGNAGLGGVTVGKLDIDTRPLSQLAAYTYYFKKSKWDQLQKETDAKIANLADLSTIALNDLWGKDKEQMVREFTALQKDAAEYASKTPATPQERLQNELEWQTKYGSFKNNYGSGKTRAVTYHKLVNDVRNNDALSAKQKQDKIDKIESEFNNTDIGTPISAIAQFPAHNLELPKPLPSKFQSEIITGNTNFHIEGEYYDPTTNAPLADATLLNIKANMLPKKGTQEYENLSQLQKDESDSQSSSPSSISIYLDARIPLNEVMAKYRKDGKFDAESFEEDNANNGFMPVYEALKNLDSYSRDHYNRAIAGEFGDKNTGAKLPSSVKADRFKAGFVNFDKPIDANKLVQSGMLAQFGDDKFEKKATPTDNAIQMARISQDYAQLNETIRHNKASENLDSEKQKSIEAKWKESQTGGTTQINGAMERAKRIYSDMLKLADKNGVITPSKLRQLNVEQLKYLGVEQVETSAAGVSKSVFKPLSFTETNSDGDEKYVPHAIQLVNGEIRVLRPKKGEKNIIKLPSGRYEGLFDPTKSTNIYNIGTNILNEELKTAGSKELNSYYGIDVTNQPTSTTDGGSTTVSGSTKMTDKEYEEFLKKNGLK